MATYVDPAVHHFGRMVMCHLWADRLDELFEMARKLGLKKSWFQKPPKASWYHFDISKSKRRLAVKYGAIETDRYGPIEHLARLNGDEKKLESLAIIRKRHALHVKEMANQQELF